jgi:Domain of unknown function (DUF4167)
LIDIVVADDNLHAAFLFDRAAMGPVAKAPGPLAHGNGESKLCLPMGTMAADWKSEDFGTSALARAEAQVGNTVGAESYYQYAEHYFKAMSSDRERR